VKDIFCFFLHSLDFLFLNDHRSLDQSIYIGQRSWSIYRWPIYILCLDYVNLIIFIQVLSYCYWTVSRR